MDNFLDTEIGLLAFVSIFHLIEGVALGMTLNRIVRDRKFSGQSVFFLVWGSMFGCMPLAFGSQGEPWLLALQVGILVVAIGVPFAMGRSLSEAVRQQGVQNMLFGGIFLIVGMIMLGFGIRLIPQDKTAFGVLAMGVIFSLVGGPIVIKGLRDMVDFDDDEEEV